MRNKNLATGLGKAIFVQALFDAFLKCALIFILF